MIYAQRPNATACADFDTWNKRMGRYVRRGSNGIALLDTTGSYPKLRYVFDVADTGAREKSRDVNLWTMEKQHIDAVAEMLVHNYGIVGNGTLSDKFEQTAAKLAAEYWQEHHRDIADIVDNSFLEEYDIDSLGMQFRSAAAVSITYSLMSRCGMNPGEHFEHEDFLAIFDFNTPDTIAALGTAVSDISEQVLRQIEVTVKNMKGCTTMKNELSYTKVGDYNLPNLTLQKQENPPLGKYGRMCRDYLKNHRPILYNRLILSEKLFPHLTEIEGTANRRMEQMMDELMKANGLNEQTKESNPMLWVQTMNNLRAQAEELILSELVYS